MEAAAVAYLVATVTGPPLATVVSSAMAAVPRIVATALGYVFI